MSITQALIEQFEKYEDVYVEVADVFVLIGRAGVRASKMYGPITRRAKDLWRFTYAMFGHNRTASVEVFELLLHDGFLKKLCAFAPDLIVSVHGMFNASILNLLEHYRIDIPYAVLLADIVDIHPLWCDARSAAILCPTPESLEASLRLGMPRSILRPCSFPMREQFNEIARADLPAPPEQPLTCLLMSGGEGSGNLKRYAQELLLFDEHCHVHILCGRNKKLHARLNEALLPEFEGRAHIHGFVTNVRDYMARSHFVVARGSPNTLMEAVMCAVPVIVTGALPGQEARNPQLMVDNGLGVICPSPTQLSLILTALLANGGQQLHKIRETQKQYRRPEGTGEIAQLLYSMARPKQRTVPYYKPKFALLHRAKVTMRVVRKPMRKLVRVSPISRRRKPK